jgi:hypothetical protein
MAPKPTFKPEWATVIGVYGGKTNAYEPAAGLKPEGDQYALPPTRNHHNWLWHYVYEWVNYLETATDADTRSASVVVAAEDAPMPWQDAADYAVAVGADAALTINAAIASLGANGGTVVLSEGTFTCETPISIDGGTPRVSIIGMGASSTNIVVSDAAGDNNGLEIADTTGVTVGRLKVSGLSLTNVLNGILVTTTGFATDVTVQEVKFSELTGGPSLNPATPRGVAVYAYGANVRVRIIDCEREAWNDGIGFVYAGEFVLSGNGARVEVDGLVALNSGAYVPSTAGALWFDSSTFTLDRVSILGASYDYGLLAAICNRWQVGHIIVEAPTTDGIQVDTCNEWSIGDAIVTTPGGNGFSMTSGTDWKIGRLLVDTPSAYGIEIATSADRFEIGLATVSAPVNSGVAITAGTDGYVNAIVKDAGSNGIELTSCTRVNVRGQVDNPGSQGVQFATCILCHVDVTNVSRAGGVGVYVDSNCARCQVIGGVSEDSTGAGLVIDGSHCQGNGFSVRTPGGVGIQVDGWNNGLAACKVENVAAADGIHVLATAQDCAVSDCLVDNVAGLTQRGIFLEGQRCDVVDCRCTDVVNEGITIGTAANDCNVIDNRVDVGLLAVVPSYGIVHLTNSARGNYVQGNRCLVAGVADLRIIGAYANVRSTPETAGGPGLPDGHDCRDNNLIASAALV